LSLKRDSSKCKLASETFFVDRLKETRPEGPVNLDRSAYDGTRQRGVSPALAHLGQENTAGEDKIQRRDAEDAESAQRRKREVARSIDNSYNTQWFETRLAMPKKKKKAAKEKLDTRRITKRLKGVARKLKAMQDDVGPEITRDDVDAARNIATELQELNRGIRETLKRMMMADGKIKPGQTIIAGSRRVFLNLRPGRSEKSLDPDDYDLVYEPIN